MVLTHTHIYSTKMPERKKIKSDWCPKDLEVIHLGKL
jgi:hypothetical protein